MQAKQLASASIISTFIIFVLNVRVSIKIIRSFLLKLLKKLIITILNFYVLILHFYLEALINHLLLFDNFCVIFKKSSRFLIDYFFKIWFKTISLCLISEIISVLFGFRDKLDKKMSRYIKYLGRNVIELFIITYEISFFLSIDSQRLQGINPIL